MAVMDICPIICSSTRRCYRVRQQGREGTKKLAAKNPAHPPKRRAWVTPAAYICTGTGAVWQPGGSEVDHG